MTHSAYLRSSAYIAMFAALLTASAWLAIPSVPPLTLQTFAVLTASLCLGAKGGMAAVAVWLALGAVGVPVFAGFGGGIGHLAGPGGGFALGFLGTALITGLCARHGRAARILGCIGGMLACYAVGTIWYAAVTGTGLFASLAVCVLPFLLPDALKTALALTLSRILRRHMRV